MELVTNHREAKHYQQINLLLENADEAWFSTAFLKEAGLKKIIEQVKTISETGSIFFVVGQNFGLTEPRALYNLREMFQSTKSKLYLAHAEESNEVFHPKFLLFRKGDAGHILVGSANLTEAGLSTNFECSISINVKVNEPIWEESLDHFRLLMSPRVSQPASLLAIKQYETFYEEQRNHNRNVKTIPARTKIQREFNYEGLLKHFVAFDTKNRRKNQLEKIQHYREARTILDRIAEDTRLTKTTFSVQLDKLVGEKNKPKLWHSGSLFRLRRKVYPHFRDFKELVRFVKSNQGRTISEIYDGAKVMTKRIEGAAANYIAEIMMTYNPAECANMNRNPLTVLREAGGVKLKAHSSSFSGKDYQEYCTIVKEIYEHLALENMLEADSFFNEIYWKIYKPRKKK